MTKINLSKREWGLLYATAAILVFYLFWQVLLSPKLSDISNLRGKLKVEKVELAASEAKIKLLEAASPQLQIEQKKEEALKRASALQVLKHISSASTSSKLDLISIRPIAQKSSVGAVVSQVQEQKFNLDCKGNYKSLYAFLQKIYSLPVLVVVDSLRITRIEEKAATLRILMQITAYF